MSNQVAVKPEVTYLDQLLHEARGGVSRIVPPEFALDAQTAAWLQQVRDHAATWVRELAIPTKRDEEWRFTDLSKLLEVNFAGALPEPPEPADVPIELLMLPEASDSRLVFVNGVFAPKLSSLTGLPEGVFVGNLGQLPANERQRLGEYLAKQPGAQEVFTALNTAGLTDAAVVWVAKNQAVEVPVHLLFVSVTGEVPVFVQPRCLVVAEAGSALTLVEHYATAAQGCPDVSTAHPYFTNAVTEIWAQENASVVHLRIQRDGGDAFHIGKTAVSQARNSRYACHAVSLGGKLSRHNLEVFQTGEATDTALYGLTMLAGEQLGDTHSTIALNHPHGTTNQLHKCIVDDRAHAVFNGKVFVPKPAQLTNAAQLNRNLLLSPKARVDTKPQLEITADNVKCSHGATVSQLEADEVFYLQSRGLDREASCNLLMDAFAGEIIQQLPVVSLRKMLSQCVACRS
ncbi:Fe-S cluster assembly protein SufD [Microcoleus sp. FACHB-68]|uniref:Fe-S cluster assembly protein SufD n=1 Tax=Microcoleus sp. FACHB-68 TaxID=2692826 RepID=UPI001684ED97|nr:Fe-S cluster assembly protein SufD [Microcoleus sp. FACHB-68]MBD1937307.1 Fe-S cluster assembly protein SufD [Microcoleus sp. FACHB-68]